MNTLQKMEINTPLAPLLASNATEQLEQELNACFEEVFNAMLAEPLHELLCYGLPHLLKDETLKRFIVYNGLNVLRSDSDNRRLSYLLKAWKVKNPKRGLHFLRTYLQMLYPNNFKISQLWQESSKAYPTALSDESTMQRKGTSHWLTSRVLVEVTDWDETGLQLVKYIPVLQSAIGAKFVLVLSVLRAFGSKEPTKIGLATGFNVFHTVQFYGKAQLPPSYRR